MAVMQIILCATFYCQHALADGNRSAFRLGRRRYSFPQRLYYTVSM